VSGTAGEVAVAAERAPERAGLWAAAGGWRGVGAAVGILAATRAAQLLLLYWLDAAAGGGGLGQRLFVWDGGWFLRVASHGYPHGYTYDHGVLAANELAFFPAYPMLVRGVAALGLEVHAAALAVSWAASVGAAVALHLFGTSLAGRRAGWALVALCCAAPMSVVLSMAYSESLFLALVTGMLVAAHRRVWWAAGLLGLGAALTRPTGLAAAVALAVAAALALRQPRQTRGRTWPPVLAAAVALAGVPAFLGWVAWRVGDPAAWFRIQAAGWGTSFDFGRSTLSFLGAALTTSDGWVPVSVALILLAAPVAAAVALAHRPWPPLAVYGLIAMALVYGQAGFYHSKPRLLLPVLLTLLPAAVAAARARPRVAVWALTAWAAFGLWYGAYLVAVWPYAI
jgi:Mannosyltransferase (PIG-V)